MYMNQKPIFSNRARFPRILAIMVIAIMVISCGNDDDDDEQILSGTFIDAPVSGLTYKTNTQKGTTDSKGTFTYLNGETITFSIDTLTLGSATGAPTLSPLDIVEDAQDATDRRVINICVLLQTIDADGDLNNGIQISEAVRRIVAGHAASIAFNQSTADFAAGIAGVINDLNNGAVFTDTYRSPRTVRDAAKAMEHFTKSSGPRKTVTTVHGQLSGYEADSNTWQWVGVPYAKPPVNGLRWQPPQAPESWEGVRHAVEWGDQAAQPLSYTSAGSGGVSENCLTLNITAPKEAANLPVMVWFHGGAFGILTANTSAYNNPASLPTKGVVLVSVNHRLGVFGYLAHPELTAESSYGGSGNYGQMDLIKALSWVQENIAAFGGDPGNVTIFGQSGGGGKAISLMASSQATGLFHKVICQSGMGVLSDAAINASYLAEAEAKGTNLSTRLGGLSITDMRKMHWLDIVNADVDAFADNAWLVYSPNIDNYYATDTLENLITAGLANDVPFLAGANSYDMVAGMNLAVGVTQQMPWRADNNDANQYLYHWSYVPPGWAALNVGAYHGLELIYVFNSAIPSFIVHNTFGLVLDQTTGEAAVIPEVTGDPNADILISTGYYDPAPPTLSEESRTLTDDIMTIWTNFAKTGDPSTPGIVDEWPVYTKESDAFVEIGAGGAFTPTTGVEAAFGTPQPGTAPLE